MITQIFHEQKFASIKHEGNKVTIKVNDNNSLLYTHDSISPEFHKEYLYETLDKFLLDNEISELSKWLARGMLGIPLECKTL
jgi:hypothetical protein